MTGKTKEILNRAVSQVAENYENSELLKIQNEGSLPDRNVIIDVIKELRGVLFPGYFEGKFSAGVVPEYYIGNRLTEVYNKLFPQLVLAYKFKMKDSSAEDVEKAAEDTVNSFFERLPEIQKLLLKDVEAGYNGDPAAQCKEEVIVSYPGFFAIYVYRLAHELYRAGVPFIPRIMTEYAHSKTGIDINPGAEIGEYFFIDHGTGVVVGETTVIGNNVKLYQGVTLGALSLTKGQGLAGQKRHPTVEDYGTIYANATILGGETVIGEKSVVGGNTFLTASVGKNVKVSAKMQELNIKESKNQ